MEIEFISSPRKLPSYNCRSLHYIAGRLDKPTKPSIGIDPGVNFGLAFLHGDFAHVYWGTLKQEREPGMYAVRAWLLFRELEIATLKMPCIIEGAAYHKQFGQVGLSEVRTGFYLSAYMTETLSSVKIIPPATIRKGVTGSGKSQAMDEYPQINHNAADSIYCALFGSLL